jgi:hypothetical protein
MLKISFDEDRLDGQQWIVTEVHSYGFSVVGKFASRADAMRYVRRCEVTDSSPHTQI